MTSGDLHQARRIAIQILCTLDVQGVDGWGALDGFLSELEVGPGVLARGRDLARAAHERVSEWDRRILGVSQRWDLARMGMVDRNVLRLALYELDCPERTPPKVAIDEAIELAKEFGAADSPGFVNGVLDAVWKKWKAEATERTLEVTKDTLGDEATNESEPGAQATGGNAEER